MKKKILSLLIAVASMGGCLSSCGKASGEAVDSTGGGDTIPLAHAGLLTLIDHHDYKEAVIRNPWDSTGVLRRYALVEGDSIPDVPSDMTVLKIPLKNTVVFSGVHASLINELGRGEEIRGMCDVNYVFDSELLHWIRADRIKDCGKNTAPDMERILALRPGGVLLSPYEGSADISKFDKLGIPVVECVDYMEPTPLGRAEWMKFYGILYGAEAKADSLFESTEREYSDMVNLTSLTENHPAVLFDRPYGNAWYVPGKYSTTGRFIEDAGGSNPFGHLFTSGAEPLSREQVLSIAGDAPIWLIRHAGENLSYSSLGSSDKIFPGIEAFRQKNVYGSDTSTTHVFEDAAFHPQWLLADMISIIHPELGINPTKRYYTPL